ncbi:hypothetical protein CK203_020213 [Vitis vinifera]|uniref:Retrovirus-related Pol polyprotein from transposon RE1 n=1 Tax=Vitis vinifera TaxID=29760 RepID=A0A438J8A8_VITVI|nr:hypothetical protein CK203_020213 [Vitis vinifera]
MELPPGDDQEEIYRLKSLLSPRSSKSKILAVFGIGMTGCKLAETPKDPSHRLGVKLKGVPIDKERYQWLVGRLIYLSHTQPDIVYVVSIAGLIKDQRSTIGCCTFIRGNLIAWRSKKRNVVAKSSA